MSMVSPVLDFSLGAKVNSNGISFTMEVAMKQSAGSIVSNVLMNFSEWGHGLLEVMVAPKREGMRDKDNIFWRKSAHEKKGSTPFASLCFFKHFSDPMIIKRIPT